MKSAYDPVKRREYYLRTRKLRGRKRGRKVDVKKVNPNTPNLNKFSTEFFNRLSLSEKKSALSTLIERLKTAHEEWINTHNTDQFKPGTSEWAESEQMKEAYVTAQKALEELTSIS